MDSSETPSSLARLECGSPLRPRIGEESLGSINRLHVDAMKPARMMMMMSLTSISIRESVKFFVSACRGRCSKLHLMSAGPNPRKRDGVLMRLASRRLSLDVDLKMKRDARGRAAPSPNIASDV